MKKNKKQLSLFKRIGLIAFAFCVAIGSLFVSVPKSFNNNFASADDTYYDNLLFTSSDIIYSRLGNTATLGFSTFSGLVSSGAVNPVYTSDLEFLKWSFSISYSSLALSFSALGSHTATIGTFSTSPSSSSDLCTPITGRFLGVVPSESRFYTLSQKGLCGKYGSIRNTMIGFVAYSPDTSAYPSLVMKSVELGSYVSYGSMFDGNHKDYILDNILPVYLYSNIVCYSDTNGWRYYFFLPTWYTYTEQPESYLTYRKYYLGNTFYDENEFYREGYNAGLLDNQQNIYNNGYNAGVDVGFNQGVQQGILQANDYSFVSLFGAVIDTPIKAFSGLFNFEILGINLLDFFLGLLTFGVIIFVIKLILGGK